MNKTKISHNITREPLDEFSIHYTYRFKCNQFLEQIDDVSRFTSYTHDEFKQIVIDTLVENFEWELKQIVFKGKKMNKETAKNQLLRLYESQIVDLTLMSKIELGDDVIKEIHRLKAVINAQDMEYDGIVEPEKRALLKDPEYASFTERLNVSLWDDAYKNYYKTVPNETVNIGDTFVDIKRNITATCKRKEIGTSKKIPILICEYEGCYIEEDCKKIFTQEEFINRCETDAEFAKRWSF